jgi:hypothetical protein
MIIKSGAQKARHGRVSVCVKGGFRGVLTCVCQMAISDGDMVGQWVSRDGSTDFVSWLLVGVRA